MKFYRIIGHVYRSTYSFSVILFLFSLTVSFICRHTRPGSLKVLVYEGVKTTPSSSKRVTKAGELLTADIVLTTYDVLKEDLFHDTDRHEGDRHLMRYQKR